MELPLEVIFDWLRALLWPLIRISAMLMVMVTIGGSSTPTRVRMALSVAITAAVAPVLPPPPAIELVSAQAVLVTAQEVLIGVAAGFVSLLVLNTFILAGQIIGMQTSLGFASMVDPSNGQQVPLVGQLFLLLSTLIFFLVDGHLLMIRMMVASFSTLPVGQGLLPASFMELANWGSLMFAGALTLALSAATALLLINFSFGVMTRAAPQLNIFAIGFPITMLSGLLILWLSLSGFMPHFEAAWGNGQQTLCSLLKLQCEAR
ncbi:flagellar type III secretion system protein FliR [Ferrimonas sediminicola]|uniref:Flagellar biosynthetic protein FliR n=1 Tax=Ferrimonas sediminicola TaxID=2569538 RepID=A0A4U1BB43_9GAMM|nr:flagellar biosynthetic protein FliR [Ferrimonas sediminicola]TKB47230.1 flagellar type III secretion system protein FliR [Ferrimonas sediminicola]